MNPLTVSVIIRTYTEARWNYLVESVESVQRQSVPPGEIVLVVDQNPTLYEKVRERFPDAVVVETLRRGSGSAWNTGIRAASQQVIAFIDDDATAEPTWLERLTQQYTDERILGVGGTIEPNWLEKHPKWFPPEFQWVVGCTYKGMPEKTAPIRNLIGCNMSFRRATLEEVGGFREIKGLGHMGSLPIGCDETELSIRIRQSHPGTELLQEPSAIVHHKVPATRSRFRYFCLRCYLEGQSKAIVSQLVGTSDGLASESAYTLKTLPLGVLKGFGDTLRGDISGLQRAGVIVIGVSITALSYLKARIVNFVQRKRFVAVKPDFEPS